MQGDKILAALETLYDIYKNNRFRTTNQFDPHVDANQDAIYEYEIAFNTIRLQAPRGSGHDTALAYFLRRHFRRVAYISPNPQMVERFKEMYASVYSPLNVRPPWIRYFSMFDPIRMHDDNNIAQTRGMRCDAVIINPASLFSEGELKNIITNTSLCMRSEPDHCYILLS